MRRIVGGGCGVWLLAITVSACGPSGAPRLVASDRGGKPVRVPGPGAYDVLALDANTVVLTRDGRIHVLLPPGPPGQPLETGDRASLPSLLARLAKGAPVRLCLDGAVPWGDASRLLGLVGSGRVRPVTFDVVGAEGFGGLTYAVSWRLPFDDRSERLEIQVTLGMDGQGRATRVRIDGVPWMLRHGCDGSDDERLSGWGGSTLDVLGRRFGEALDAVDDDPSRLGGSREPRPRRAWLNATMKIPDLLTYPPCKVSG